MKKNLLSIIGVFIGVIGILLSLYFYEKTKVEREPTFVIDPIKTEILDSKSIHIAPIKVFTLDSVEIKNDLTSTIFYFWNKGQKPIRKNDLLEAVTIHLDSLSKIVDFKILKSSRDVCGINLTKTDENTLKLDFDILEYNDGFTAQIIYEGERNSKILLSTIIVGVNNVSGFAVSKYKLLGKTITNIGIGILLIFLFLLSSSTGSSRHEPDYIHLKETDKYKESKEYQANVDRLEEIEKKASEIRDKIYDRKKSEKSPDSEEKRQSRKRFWIRFGISVGIVVVIVAMIIAWRVTRNEIYNNPVQYIPETIKPNN